VKRIQTWALNCLWEPNNSSQTQLVVFSNIFIVVLIKVIKSLISYQLEPHFIKTSLWTKWLGIFPREISETNPNLGIKLFMSAEAEVRNPLRQTKDSKFEIPGTRWSNITHFLNSWEDKFEETFVQHNKLPIIDFPKRNQGFM